MWWAEAQAPAATDAVEFVDHLLQAFGRRQRVGMGNVRLISLPSSSLTAATSEPALPTFMNTSNGSPSSVSLTVT